MASVRDHYSNLLGQHYHHLAPRLDEAERQLTAFGIAKVPEGAGRQAVDLGSGTGVYTAALSRLGYRATGIDTCSALVAKARSDWPTATFNESDILVYQPAAPLTACVLLDDTVRHLPTLTSVHSLVMTLARHFEPGGQWLTTFRADKVRQGEERFVDVAANDELTMTSFSERDGDYELVTDLIRTKARDWQLEKSRYRKLIVQPEMLEELFAASGFAVSRSHTPGGLTAILATKNS